MAAISTSQAAIQRWSQGMQGASQKYIDGTNAVSESPMAKAAAQGQVAMANYAQAITSGRWAESLNAVSLESWKQACRNVGAARFATGATKGLPKYTRFAQNAVPVWQAMRAAARAAGTDPIAKFTAAFNVLKAAGRKGGGTAFG